MKLRISVLALLAVVVTAGGNARATSTEPSGTHRLASRGVADVGQAGRGVQVLCTREVARPTAPVQTREGGTMPIEDRIESYSVHVAQNNFQNFNRTIRLSLESGGTAFVAFPDVRPTNWLQLNGASTNLFMTRDQFTDVYHLLQSESPVFFTALDLLGFQVGAVHTELDLSVGEPAGEGDADAQSLEALVWLAREQGLEHMTTERSH